MKTPELPSLAKIEDESKVITLLCYLLEYLGGLTESQLLEILTTGGLVEPFKLNDALAIIETRELATLKGDSYSINEAGRTWLRGYENSLAITLRRMVLQNGKDVVRLSELRKSVKWRVAEVMSKSGVSGGWVFHACFLNEKDGSPIMEIKLYDKTREGAQNAQEKFLKNPAKALTDSMGNLI
ncbi:MAG: DUF4364 family protein [Oscillospiraceae bacterium]|nr:DUF4364 family protein [Oscillospiraceae bacterium]